MVHKLSVEEILRLNPRIDPKILKRVKELHEWRGKRDVAGKRHNLASPYGRRRAVPVRAGDVMDSDPRTVYLRQTSKG